MKMNMTSSNEELETIEEELRKLENRKKQILEEEKNKKLSEKKERKKEVEEAYNHFLTLLEKYENDFEEGYTVKLSGAFS